MFEEISARAAGDVNSMHIAAAEYLTRAA